jgi:peptidyl-prolyl cis-trans isomerase B (cyclophilin B)
MVTLHTNHGDIIVQLHQQQAPMTVKNFLTYCREGFYNNTLFHRVIKGFMIQGGGFTLEMQQKQPQHAAITNEADNGLLNQRGSLAMARTNDPHSASSQFFMNTTDNDFLNFKQSTPQGWGYCVFGQITSGLEVLDNISQVKTGNHPSGHQDVPLEAVVLTHITLAE